MCHEGGHHGLIVVNELGEQAVPLLNTLTAADSLGVLSTNLEDLMKLALAGRAIGANAAEIATASILDRIRPLNASSRPRVLILADERRPEVMLDGVVVARAPLIPEELIHVANHLRDEPHE
ncbi:MAG: hypothetical protein ACJ790_20430 [Myxococcaceae bacterium]